MNVRGLGQPFKNQALKRLVDKYQPHIMLIQEYLFCGDTIAYDMKGVFPRWDFSFIEAIKRSGGLISGWKKTHFPCLNSWTIQLGLGNILFSRDFGWAPSLINVYGPNQHRQGFWDHFFQNGISQR